MCTFLCDWDFKNTLTSMYFGLSNLNYRYSALARSHFQVRLGQKYLNYVKQLHYLQVQGRTTPVLIVRRDQSKAKIQSPIVTLTL